MPIISAIRAFASYEELRSRQECKTSISQLTRLLRLGLVENRQLHSDGSDLLSGTKYGLVKEPRRQARIMQAKIIGSYWDYGKEQGNSCLFRRRIISSFAAQFSQEHHINPTEDQEWRKRLRGHDRTLLTAIVSVLLLYLIGLVAVIRLAFRPLEDNVKTLQRRLKDSGH